MIDYLKGNIVDISDNYVVIDVCGVGYIVNVANTKQYHIGEGLIYIYQYIRDNINCLYGFQSKCDRDIFLKLISVKGLGCKMALPMFADDSSKTLINAINNEEVNYLKRFPKIGEKLARQIILDLRGKLVNSSYNNDSELIQALKKLGYKRGDINRIIKVVNINDSLENQIKEALRLLVKL